MKLTPLVMRIVCVAIVAVVGGACYISYVVCTHGDGAALAGAFAFLGALGTWSVMSGVSPRE